MQYCLYSPLPISPWKQGEMAQMYAEQEFDQLMDSSVEDVFPAYKKLRKELLKRKEKSA